MLPEYFSVAGDPDFLRGHAETLTGPTVTWASHLAGQMGIWLLAGSFPERPTPLARGRDPRLSNTSCLIGPSGAMEAVYRKIHLFDVTLSGAGFRESATMAPGDELCGGAAGAAGPDPGHGGARRSVSRSATTSASPRCTGSWRSRGATVIAVPAAFTAVTGPAHWELLLRARAVENQVFVIGAGQVGDLPDGMPSCHGHSMIVDPWGTILAERTRTRPGGGPRRPRRRPPRRRSAPSCRCWLIAAPTPTVGRMTKPGATGRRSDESTPGRATGPGSPTPAGDGQEPSAAPPFEVGIPRRRRASQLYYEIHGHGPRVLVFIHGILMDSNMNRRLAADLAANGHRVILLDLPGHGRSDKPNRASFHRMDTYADHVVALLDHLGIETAVIGGVSLGANVSLLVAAQAPERVRGPGHRDAGPRVGGARRRHHLRAHAAGRPLRPPVGQADRLVVPAPPPHRHRCARQRDELAVQRSDRDGRGAPRDPGRSDRPDRRPAGGHGRSGPGDRPPGGPDPPVPRCRAAGPTAAQGRLIQANSVIELRVHPERLTAEIGKFLDDVWAPPSDEDRKVG